MPKVFLLYLFSSLAVYFLLVSDYKLSHLSNLRNLSYLIFFAWIVFTSLIGLSFYQSFLGSYFRWQGILTWLSYSLLFLISSKMFEDERFKKHACLAILISATFTSILAITQFLSLWFLGHTNQLLYSNRVIATFGQPDFLGAYLVMSLPFIWYLYKNYSSSRQWIPAFAGIIIILGIFSTLSRSAYLGLAVLMLTWGFYHYKLLLTSIVFSVLLFGIIATISPNLVYSQWYRLQVDLNSKWTAENRLVIAQKSIQLIFLKPIFGYGLENFSLSFPQVIKEQDLGLKDIVVDSSHNLFLDIAVQTGLIGLGLFLAILILTVKQGLSLKDGFSKACLSAVIAFVIIHQFSPVSMTPMVLFWICMGIINPASIIALGDVRNQRPYAYIAQFMGISLIVVTSFFIIQTIRADIIFRDSSAYEVSDIKRSIKLDNDAISIAPWINFYKIRRDFLLKQLGH